MEKSAGTLRPNLFILGAPKCGTSALAEYLTVHARVASGAIKEPNYWSTDLPHFARREGLQSLADYEELYATARVAKPNYMIDASTHYLFSKVAMEHILRYSPSAKFIVCLRPPSEIAVAWHMQMVNAGYESVTDFETAWHLIGVRREGENISRGCPEAALTDYEAVASVGSQLARVASLCDPSRLLVVFQQELRESPSKVLDASWRFLGLDPIPLPSRSDANAAFASRSRLISRATRAPAVRKSINRIIIALGEARSRKLKDQFRRVLYRQQQRSALSPSGEQTVRDALAEQREIIFGLDDTRCFLRCSETPACQLL